MAVSCIQVVYQRSTAGLQPFVPQPHITHHFDLRTHQRAATCNCKPLRLNGSYRPDRRLHCSRPVVAASDLLDASYDDLKAGSPIMIIEAPPHLKTAEPMPMLRANKGFVMPGDAGRIISRKPKDVWAIRFKSGAFLIERRYFKPLDVE